MGGGGWESPDAGDVGDEADKGAEGSDVVRDEDDENLISRGLSS